MTYRLTVNDRTTSTNHSQGKALLLLSIFIATAIASLSVGIARAVIDTTTPPAPLLMITGAQTGGCSSPSIGNCVESPAMEYVEIYNPGATDLTVSGWKLRYLSSSGNTVTDLTTISGSIKAHGYVVFTHAGYYTDMTSLTFGNASDSGKLAKSAGHLEIIDSSGNSIDRVGWGTAERPLVKAAGAPAAGKALERRADDAGALVYTGNNSLDFSVVDTPTPRTGGFMAPMPEPITPTTPPVDSTPVPTPPPSQPSTTTCEGVVVSELLPNPAGTDTGHEFIELFNPTNEVIALDGCSLKSTASSTKSYEFAQTSLQPGEYRSFGDATTGITLPNSAGGTVWLLSPTEELQAIVYSADMADDTSWALFNDAWMTTHSPTPGAANIDTPLKPCDDPSQVRNTDTGRCATPEVAAGTSTAAASSTIAASSLTPCKAGQERNPETNRCRTIASTAAAGLTACKEGQERNPDTNRCKAIGSTTSASAACPAGQERNPDTNRCKKIAASVGNGISDVKDVSSAASQASQRKPYWLISAVVGVVVIGYGIYEWRQEISQLFRKRKSANTIPL